MRSISADIDSIPTSMRSSRAIMSPTGSSLRSFFFSPRRKYMMHNGSIVVTLMKHMPPTIMTKISLSMSGLDRAGGFYRNCEFDSGTDPDIAVRRHRSIVRPHRLARNREPEPGTTRFIGHIRLPDAFQLLRADSGTVVLDPDGYCLLSLQRRL